MAKIIVDVSTPGNGKTYEFQLDDTMLVGFVKRKMMEEISEFENGNITLDPTKVALSSLSAEQSLSEADTIRAAGVRSGQRLLLV